MGDKSKPDYDPDSDDERFAPTDGLEEVPDSTPREMIVSAWGAITSIVNSASFMLSIMNPMMNIPTLIGSAGSAAMGPIAHKNEQEVTDVASMGQVSRRMRLEMDRLAAENKRLKYEVERLESTVGSMEDIENALDEITKQQGASIEALQEQVDYQRGILEEMREDARSGMLQNLLTVIIASDEDGDFTIDPDEIDVLVENIRGAGFKVNHANFAKVVEEKNGSIQAVLEICKSVMDGGDDTPEEHRIIWTK